MQGILRRSIEPPSPSSDSVAANARSRFRPPRIVGVSEECADLGPRLPRSGPGGFLRAHSPLGNTRAPLRTSPCHLLPHNPGTQSPHLPPVLNQLPVYSVETSDNSGTHISSLTRNK
ncbi:Hypothetical protein NTJ_08929 [Nesidiocoris tenuis]|uniref:Uncharacterized protein n=1 Tax=Nesidiocoris tenuis TaxID=355587 RepID=A0ABN7AZ02_9HEMI|nr:Hypothetical protein NTJ_08929 [Nesidiocoris tenuis]